MKKKKVYFTLVGDNLNEGHLNLFKIAKNYGNITIGLMTDNACVEYTSLPHFSYEYRKNFLIKNLGIRNIIPHTTLDYTDNLKILKPDFVIHGDDWRKGFLNETRKKVIKQLKIWNGKLIEVPYTKNIPYSENRKQFLQSATTTEIRKSKLSRLLKVKKNG